MQIIKSLPGLSLFLFPLLLSAQSAYLQQGSKDYILLDRLEIKTNLPGLNFSNIKPYNRRLMVAEVEKIDSLIAINSPEVASLSKVDKYNISRFLMNNSEWSKPRPAYNSSKPILKTFYQNKGNLLEVNNPNFFLALNPLLTYQQSFEKNNSQNTFLNSRGIAFRGMISKKVGFQFYLTENQERGPQFVQQYITRQKAVPGVGYYKTFKNTGVDYLDVRGSVQWNVAQFIDMQLGYDKNVIGSGYRSLFLSDFSNNATFLKINTRIWKLNYENLYMELMPQFNSKNNLMSRKYFRMNHLSINATKWLNVGLFDAVMFGRKDHFDFQYLVPVLFLRPAEQQVGSPDNAVMGLDAKVNISKKVLLYGQLMFDEFKLDELRKNTGWWANKYGYQLGVKYVDAFGVKNLDIQVETNRLRPFTYSHYDSLADYTHYNMPMAHPLGANLQEYVVVIKAQPIPKLYITAKVIHYFQGLDIAGRNFGSNPTRLYTTRTGDYGYNVGDGNKMTVTNAIFSASYELFENMFFDFTAQQRNAKFAIGNSSNTTVISAGMRWNMAKREFDF